MNFTKIGKEAAKKAAAAADKAVVMTDGMFEAGVSGISRTAKGFHESKPVKGLREAVYDRAVRTTEEAEYETARMAAADEYRSFVRKKAKADAKLSRAMEADDAEKIEKYSKKSENFGTSADEALERLNNIKRPEGMPEDASEMAAWRHGKKRADAGLVFEEDGVALPFRLTKGAGLALGAAMAAGGAAATLGNEGLQQHNVKKLGRITYPSSMARMTNQSANTGVMDEISRLSDNNYEVYQDLASTVLESPGLQKIEDYGANAEMIAALYGMGGR